MMGMYRFQGYGSGISSDDEVNLQRGTRANGTLHDEVEEFAGTEGFRGFEEHRVGNIEDKINDRANLFPVELHCIVSGAGVSLPVDVAGVIAGGVGSVILEIKGRAHPGTQEFTSLTLPYTRAQGQSEFLGAD